MTASALVPMEPVEPENRDALHRTPVDATRSAT